MTATALTPLTFAELVTLTEKSLSSARNPDKVAGWRRLLEVLRPLAGSPTTAGDLVTGRTWALTRIRALNYQGVGPAIDMTFPSTPGITVLHGPNGSGKSSVADAVETALLGEPRPAVVTGRGRDAALWERRHCGRDATRAHVQVTLVSGAETLTLTCRIDSDGAVVDRPATLDTGSGPQPIDAPSGTWRSALHAHRPVFGYAALERRLQRADDLREFLEPMLAFGGCVDTLAERLAEASEPARTAADRWRTALRAAQRAVTLVDQQYERADTPSPPPVTWPAAQENCDEWLERHGLTTQGGAPPDIGDGVLDRTRQAAENAAIALDELERASTSVRDRFTSPLHQLRAAAQALDDPGETCPVCGGPAAGWVTDLGSRLDEVTAVDRLDARARTAIGSLAEVVHVDVSALAGALRQGLCDPEREVAARPAVTALIAFADRVSADGTHTVPATRAAAREAAAAFRSEAWAAAVTQATERSDHHARWRSARRDAITPLLGAWPDLAATADSEVWANAARCLSDLQDKIRTRRAGDLRDLTSATVRDLLRDADLAIDDISVKKTSAAVGVVDGTGKQVSLSMLSAGQRNALLLAPLLAVAHGGPFGFLVLDDPVHALDQIRIDRLARALETIAAQRRVIVLTHDERLVEHLQATSVDCETRTVERTHATGRVEDTPRKARWSVLVNDARAVFDARGKNFGGVTQPPTDLVRNLCRMAFDAGLRAMVVNAASVAHRDPQPNLDQLDAVDSTKRRITEAEKLYPGSAALSTAKSHVDPYLDDWNRAAHGNVARSVPTAAEINATRNACLALECGP